jgi:hypothetical protein
MHHHGRADAVASLFGGLKLGIIVSAIQKIKPTYDFCLQMARNVHTCDMQDEMEKFVIKCFKALKPLSDRHKNVCHLDQEYGYGELCVGEWLRCRYSYQRYGSYVESADRFFELIRKYGEKVQHHVRRSIAKEFEELVELVVQLKPHNSIRIHTEIPETEVFAYEVDRGSITEHAGITIRRMTAKAVGFETRDPWAIDIELINGEHRTIGISSDSRVIVFEDLVGYLADLYVKAEAAVSEVKKHNEAIMAEMDKVVAPWMVTNSFKGA